MSFFLGISKPWHFFHNMKLKWYHTKYGHWVSPYTTWTWFVQGAIFRLWPPKPECPFPFFLRDKKPMWLYIKCSLASVLSWACTYFGTPRWTDSPKKKTPHILCNFCCQVDCNQNSPEFHFGFSVFWISFVGVTFISTLGCRDPSVIRPSHLSLSRHQPDVLGSPANGKKMLAPLMKKKIHPLANPS